MPGCRLGSHMIHSLEDLYDDMGISHDITNIWVSVFGFFCNFGPVLVLYVFHVHFFIGQY